jgi:hypothetical protein
MLRYDTVEPGTLELLKQLMDIPELGNFYLAGGTALALYRGHRKSIDLDLFSTANFTNADVVQVLEKHFPSFTYSNPNSSVGVFSFINDIKVDLVNHHHFQWISEPTLLDGIRLVGIADIMAMKIAAIMNRAVKKDFWDISELLTDHTIDALIDSYDKKYPNQRLLISAPQAMTYFKEAEDSEDPVSLKGQTWASVKDLIQEKVSAYLF